MAIAGIKKALGLAQSATAEDVGTVIATNPDAAKAALESVQSELAAKYAYLTRVAEVEADVAKTGISEVNQTIRAEVSAQAATPHGWWSHWRTIMAYELALECPPWALLIMWCVLNGKINELNAAAGILTVWWGARFAVLGVHIWTGSNERQTAIAGIPPPSVFGSVAAKITGKK
jgi:hypothetical protein